MKNNSSRFILYLVSSVIALTAITSLALWRIPASVVNSLPSTPTEEDIEILNLEIQVRDSTTRSLTTIGQFSTALAIIFGVYFTWKGSQENKEKQISERFSKAVEHLGSDNLPVRAGGVIELMRLCRDSPRDIPLILDVTCSFIRERSRISRESSSRQRIDIDIQLCINLIKESLSCLLRNLVDLDKPLDLRGSFLKGADFSEFRRQMQGTAADSVFVENNLKGRLFLDLTGSDCTSVNFKNANLYGIIFDNADLARADFSGAVYNKEALARANSQEAIGLS